MTINVSVKQQNIAFYLLPSELLNRELFERKEIFTPNNFLNNLRYILSHREYREGSLRKITKAEVARRIGVSRMEVNNWLNNRHSPNSYALMQVNVWANQLRLQKQQSSSMESSPVLSGQT